MSCVSGAESALSDRCCVVTLMQTVFSCLFPFRFSLSLSSSDSASELTEHSPTHSWITDDDIKFIAES